MKVFISWSGERSLALARALHEWLPLVLQYVDPWFSQSDIDAGQRWNDDLSKRLSECNFGIACVTKDNVNAPWLLFEAGALAKSVDNSRLVPLLLDIDQKDFTGPLSQFQAKKVDKDGIASILTSINNSASARIPEGRLPDLIDMAWDKLASLVEAIPSSTVPAIKSRNQSEILEELVAGVRSVEARVRDFSDEGEFSHRRRRQKFHPEMMLEMSHHALKEADDPLRIVIVSSLLREDIPWLYEIGLLAYRAIRNGEVVESRRTLKLFQRGLEAVLHGPMIRGPWFDRERYHMLIMSAEGLLEGDMVDRYSGKLKRPRKVTSGTEISESG